MLPPTIPLFPLPNVVLFPGVFLPLHIFEERYRAMTRDALAGELREYFAGTRTAFTARIVQRGSPFSTAVWAALCEIPCGETRSYGELAAHLGRPSAVRAVARANGANQVAILVPCHRVIGADGTLVGYGGKLWRKQWLLDHERKSARLF